MQSDAYWSNRFENLNEAQLKKGEAYIQSLEGEYNKAVAAIQKEIDAFYHRYAKCNEISLADTRQALTAAQLKQFKSSVEEYTKTAKETALDQRWISQLENASKKAKVSRIEALQIQVGHQVEQLYAKKQEDTYWLLHGIYKDNYDRSIFELQKGTGKNADFAKLEPQQIDETLSKPWAPDGKFFRDRILDDKNKLVKELQAALVQGFIRGDPSDKVVLSIAERVNVAKSSSSRLVLTEAAHFSGQSRIKAYEEMGVEKYKFVSKLDSRTSSKCRQMDGQVIALAEAQAGVNYPPLHAYCRSTTIPYYEGTGKGDPPKGSTPYEHRYTRDPDTGELIDFEWVTTRQVDQIIDKELLIAASKFKGNLSNTVLKSGKGNFSYTKVELDIELPKKEYYAHSQVEKHSGNPNIKDISGLPDDPIFEATTAPNALGIESLRIDDTEYKILT